MKYFVMSVRDSGIEAFGQPFYVVSIGQATRSFSDAINSDKQDDMLAKHPDDFTLFHLGEFDDARANFELLPSPRIVAVGKDMKKS